MNRILEVRGPEMRRLMRTISLNSPILDLYDTNRFEYAACQHTSFENVDTCLAVFDKSHGVYCIYRDNLFLLG